MNFKGGVKEIRRSKVGWGVWISENKFPTCLPPRVEADFEMLLSLCASNRANASWCPH